MEIIVTDIDAVKAYLKYRDHALCSHSYSSPRAFAEVADAAIAELEAKLAVAEALAAERTEQRNVALSRISAAEAEVALRDRMLVAEYDSPTPKTAGYMRWFADLRARAEKEDER